MIGEEFEIRKSQHCEYALTVILDLIKYECQGFILPPTEVKNLLGIPKNDRMWYLNKRVRQLKKLLANNYIAMEISPDHGISVILYQVPVQSLVPCSPRRYTR